MVKALEGKPCEEQLRALSLFSLEEAAGRPPRSLQLPPERQTLPSGEWPEAASGEAQVGYQEQVLHPGDGRALNRLCRAVVTALGLPELKKSLYNAQARGGILGAVLCRAWSLMILVSPFQLRAVCDSVNRDCSRNSPAPSGVLLNT